MSLRYWFPFNNSFINNGFDNSFVELSSSPVYGDGKTCPKSLDVSYSTINIPWNYAETNQISVAFWVKPKTPNAWSDIISLGAGANRIEKSSSDTYVWYNNSNALLASGTTMFNMSDAIWYHVAVVADGSSVKFYLNGTLAKTSAQSNHLLDVFARGNYILVSMRTTDGGNRYYGYLNDLRIYDHAISEKEISELSKGLAAHYKLHCMGRPNFLNGAGKYTSSNPLLRLSSDTSHMNDSYVYHGDLTATITKAGTYTLVMECDGSPSGHATSGTKASERRVSMWLNDTSANTHYCWSSPAIGANGEMYGTFSNLPAGTYRIRTNLYAADNVTYALQIWNMKLVEGAYEQNDIWCPNSADPLYTTLGLDKEYDCSGYSNNLTKYGTVNALANSPRHRTCVDFNNTGYFYSKNFGLKTNQFTVSFWANAPASVKSQHFLFGTHNNWTGDGFSAWTDSGLTYSVIIKSDAESSHGGLAFTLKANTWEMITYVYTGTTLIHYKNGVEVSRTTYGKGGSVLHPNLYLGNSWYNNAPASEIDEAAMSDFRFYATALSATDISELYKNSASLDNNGTMFAYDFLETNTNDIGANGVLSTGSFSDTMSPLYDMETTVLTDGSAWARIHYLDVMAEKSWFTAAEVTECLNKRNRYSRMGVVDNFKINNQYEFMLTYPSLFKILPMGDLGYTRLDYIEATGTQYIKTGVTGAARWEFDIQFTNTTTRQLMGYGGSGSEYWGSQENGMYGLATWSYMNVASGGRDTIVHDYTGTNSLWVKNTSLGISQTDVSSMEYQIFAIGGSYLCKAKLYRCRCIKDGSLVRDFVPVLGNIGGDVGLYDVVNGVYYGNNGNGVFLPGPVCDESVPLYNRWIQTSSPNASTVTGFKPLATAWTAHNAGIRKHGSQCVYNCDSGSTWYAPIGQTSTWTDTQFIPAADGSSQTSTELWVRIDGLAKETQFNIFKGSMTANGFMEL